MAPRTGIAVVRHSLERHRPSNTVRWAALAMPALRLVEHGAPGAIADTAPLVRPGTWLVYPGGSARPASDTPEALLFLDGSWAQTRRMLQRLPGLAALPRLSLDSAPSRRRLRQPPTGGLATLEAIAAALALVGEAEAATKLDALYALAVTCSFDDLSLAARQSGC